MKALAIAIAACFLATPASAKTLLSSWSQLTLVGGFKMPTGTIDGYNMVTSFGSIDLRPGSTTWITHHSDAGQYIVELIEPAGGPNMTFPSLTYGRYGKPLTGADKNSANAAIWLDADNVMVSGRNHYRSNGDWHWSSIWNLDTGTETVLEIGHVDDSADWAEGSTSNKLINMVMTFAGGFVRIPDDWAATYTGGRTIGMARGGYDTLMSPFGPSLGAWKSGDNSPLKIMEYQRSAWTTDGYDHYEIRPNKNYLFPVYGGDTTPTDFFWPGDSPDGGGYAQVSSDPVLWGPTGDTGYFSSDDVSSGAGWIDDTTWKGVVYGVTHPEGYIDYTAQDDLGGGELFWVEDPSVFYSMDSCPDYPDNCANRWDHINATEYANGPDGTWDRSLYVYDPDCLAQARELGGTQAEWECTPTVITADFSSLPFDLWDGNGSTKIGGVFWDKNRNYLWLTLTKIGDNDNRPIMVAYALGEAIPNPTTGHKIRLNFVTQ